MKSVKYPQRRKRRLFTGYVVFLLILTISIATMPIMSLKNNQTQIPLAVSGGCFWLGLIGTIVMALRFVSFAKKSRGDDKRANRGGVGLIRFFRNTEAKIADAVMLCSAVGLVMAGIWDANLYWLFSIFALLVFSFGMHCMLNGRNYIYLNQKVRREKES